MSPEMALNHEEVQKAYSTTSFMQNVLAVYIDEAHCISQWGGDFRKDYGRLGSLRAIFRRGTPFVLLSASFRPRVLKDVTHKLGFNDTAVILNINIGNERVNVALGIRPMVETVSSLRDLDFLVPEGTEDIDSIDSTMLYIDNVLTVTEVVIYLTSRLGPTLQAQGIIQPIHAWMPDDYRDKALDALVEGKIRIAVCTEAAGMVR